MSLTIQAQNTEIPKRKCATMEYLEQQKVLDPTLEERMKAQEEIRNEWIKNNQDEINNSKANEIYIPVVVHVVGNNTIQNAITDPRVQEQIDVLNTDYAGLNTHPMNAFTPSATYKTDTKLRFCLAKRDPNGNATTGIERRTGSGVPSSFSYGTLMKHQSSGGLDQWNPQKYMNIWVCNLSGGLCGFAEFPTNPLSSNYGVVINYKYFGKTGAEAPYNLGGTTSHEIGHCFNLLHIWGDDGGSCTYNDGITVTDTPNQADATYGNHLPYNSLSNPGGNFYNTGQNSTTLTDACSTTSPGIQYMNFMDYTDDVEYSNFTPKQKGRIDAVFAPGQPLNPLKTSLGCTPVGIEEGNFIQDVTIYPNPTNDEININFNLANANNVDVSIYNLLGKKVYSSEKNNISVFNSIVDLRNQASGVYFVKIKTAKQTVTQKITLVR